MTELTNGTEAPPPPALCAKTNDEGLRCRREENHQARHRYGEARPAKPKAAFRPIPPVLPRPRISVIIVGGEPDAREAVAKFVLWALEGLSSHEVDSTFSDPPRSVVDAAAALETYRISIRNAGG